MKNNHKLVPVVFLTAALFSCATLGSNTAPAGSEIMVLMTDNLDYNILIQNKLNEEEREKKGEEHVFIEGTLKGTWSASKTFNVPNNIELIAAIENPRNGHKNSIMLGSLEYTRAVLEIKGGKIELVNTIALKRPQPILAGGTQPVASAESAGEDETQAAAPPVIAKPKKEPWINVSAAFSWYPSFGGLYGTATFDKGNPADLDVNYDVNLQLQMGLKLFKDLSAFIDFGIEDPVAQKVLNIAGKINAKWFGLQLDYRTFGGTLNYWSGYGFNELDIGDRQKRNPPPDKVIPDFAQRWMTVALMTPKTSFNVDGFDIRVGLIYVNAKTAAILWHNREASDWKSFLDTDFTMNMFGARLSFGVDQMNEGALPVPWARNIYPMLYLTFDFAPLGGITPGDSALNKIKAAGASYAKDGRPMYIRLRGMGGWWYKKEFSETGSFNAGLGVDLNGEFPRISGDDIGLLNNFLGIGFFARVGVTY